MKDLPPGVADYVMGLDARSDALGKSRSRVTFFGTRFALKVSRVGEMEPLSNDRDVLAWLGQFLPVPTGVAYEVHRDQEYLLMSCLPGKPASDLECSEKLIKGYANALRQFHEALPVDTCPFDYRINKLLDECEVRFARGLIDLDNLDEERRGWSAERLWRELQNSRPEFTEDLVVVHGDYCMPNVLFDPDTLQLTGYVDLGRVGVSDRHHDLALAARSIAHNFGSQYIEVFFEAYGTTPNPELIAFYALIDEFF